MSIARRPLHFVGSAFAYCPQILTTRELPPLPSPLPLTGARGFGLNLPRPREGERSRAMSVAASRAGEGAGGGRWIAFCLALLCMCTLWSTQSVALDPALDVSQYAHTAWRNSDGFFGGD